ncbi:hypothetical protein D3C78_1646960 [compost metagenome]
MVAPIDRGVNTSRYTGSWPRPESREKVSAGVKPCWRTCQSMKCTSGAWWVTIPLGSPVLPEVKVM